MPTPTLTAPPTPAPNKYGQDPVTFDAAMQARLDWQATNTAQEAAMVAWVADQVAAVDADVLTVQSNRLFTQSAAAAVAAANPATNAAAAQSAAAAAAVSAGLAQATNPDSPIRLNPRAITANFTVASAYNATSTGPITISPGVTVTVQDHATWAIH